jgi:hypothetical protein
VCYNTDWGIVSKASKLVPWAYARIAVPSGFNRGTNTKTCYGLETAQRDLMYDLLTQILPYMAHTQKRVKAEEILAYIEGVRSRREARRSCV